MRIAGTPTLFLACGAGCGPAFAQAVKVALDCFHNDESSPHYTWKRSGVGGYADFAQVIRSNGGDTASLRKAFDAASLAPFDALIVSDPDTPRESPNPRYVSAAEAAAVDLWVQDGGLLFLLANDAGNCEFANFNGLAGKFGVKFNEDLVAGPTFSPLPAHPFFTGCRAIFMRDVSSLTLSAPAQAVLTLDGKVLMATAKKGKGTVVAVGDPWMYDEHINDDDNHAAVTNVIKWWFAQKGVTGLRPVALGRPAARSAWHLADGKASLGPLAGRRQQARQVLFRQAP